MLSNDIIYDIEVFPNVFTMVVHRVRDGARRRFEISQRRNDFGPLKEFMSILVRQGCRMVGFNNRGYDYPVLHFLLNYYADETSAMKLTDTAYGKSMSIIEAPFHARFNHIIPDYKQIVPQIDLYLIHHFDNQARSTSLKVLEFNMRMHDIREMPVPLGTHLDSDQIDTLIEYNAHDVEATVQFYRHSVPAIEFREALSAKYDRNFLNHNDTKIGKDYFIMQLERQAGPQACYERVDGKREPKQTKRETIALADIIFPYIQFRTPQFRSVLDWMKAQVISETRGVFTGIPEAELGELARYADLKTVKGNVKNLNVMLDDVQFVFGTGGIHASRHAVRVESDNDYVIIDVDVTSYYPSLAITHKLYPEHLGEQFFEIYADMKAQRVKYAKGTPENAMLKLALNGVFGDSNSKFSPFYDPKYTMGITVNGQLLLCMLYETMREIEGLQLIQMNTDGVTVRLPRNQVDELQRVCVEWELLTGLQLEEVRYDFMHIRDVNSYICKFEGSDKVKRKGAYEYEIDWHQNHSALIVKKAAEANIVHGTDIAEFIWHHEDDHDFMLRTKVPKTSILVGVDEDFNAEWEMQNITRYYIAHDGVELMKIMPPLPKKPGQYRRIAVNKGLKVVECNKLKPIDRLRLNFDWYIREAKALVNFK